jgi:DNA polymerase I-like protein with 3'-5' exonuclease and polymerase domains
VVHEQVYCPTVPSSWFYVRRNGKIFVTGNTTYYGTPFTMARHLKVPVKLMEEFQTKFLGQAYPGISKWHRWVAQQLQTTRRLTTPFGRERQFFGRPNDDTTLREAIAYSPQSSTAERTNLGLWRIWKYMSDPARGSRAVQVLHQNHDAVYFQYRPEHEAEVVPEALRLMEIEVRQNGRSLVVPGEAQVGWNWGKHHDERKPTPGWRDPKGVWHENRYNPDGLKKWKGKDERTRTALLDRPL